MTQATLPEVVTDQRLTESPETGIAQMFERLACNPDASVEKIERLMALWERTEAKKAEALFNRAMATAQKAMRPVAADAYNPQTKSKYASYAALDNALRPIYTDHGFALSFGTGDAPLPEYVRVVCDVTHLAGHAKPYHIDMPADGKGAKGGDVMTKTHAAGSAVSYGMRYLLRMIFNVAVGEDDDDGQAAGGKAQPDAPKGYENWFIDMTATADNGMPALTAAWAASPKPFQAHVTKTNRAGWEALKVRAAKVKTS